MFRGFFAWFALTVALFLFAAPASAEWHEASSDHFIIYADAKPEDLQLYAENLERYHSAIALFTERDIGIPSPSNRVTVYALGSDEKVRRLAGSTGVAGFFLPRAQGSVAFVPNVQSKTGYPDISTVILLHEYAHHFLSQTDRFARPLWMNEGAAEFFANAYFDAEGSVFLGAYRLNRGFQVFLKEDEMTSVSELLDIDWDRLKGRNAQSKNSFYGRSWQLYHYITNAPDRDGQLRAYWLEVLKGTPSIDAGRKVFGDFGVLERQLNQYLRSRDKKSFKFEADRLSISPVSLRRLPQGEAAVMEQRFRIERGVAANEATALAGEIQPIAERNPDEAMVWTLLSEARLRAGESQASLVAAERALALDPRHADALMFKGLALFQIARAIADPDQRQKAYEQAMEPMRALAALEPDHIVPLIYTYRAMAEQGIAPDEAAKAAYFRAAELAPFDQELWLIRGMIHMNDGQIADARAALGPVASNPHGGEKAEQIRQLLVFLADKPEGQAIPVQAAISQYLQDE